MRWPRSHTSCLSGSHLLPAIIAALLTLALASPVQAETVAVLQPDPESPAATAVRKAILAELEALGLEASPGSNITLTELLAVNACDTVTSDCAAAIRETVYSDSVIWLSVEEGGDEPLVKMAWYNGEWPPETVETRVPADTRGPILAARLLLRPEEGHLIVDASAAAMVSIDGGAQQPVNTVFSLSPGTHDVSVIVDSAEERRELTVRPGEWQHAEFELEPIEVSVDEPTSPPPAWLGTAGWVLLGTGGAALVGSAITFALVGSTESELKNITGRRPLTEGDLTEAQELDERGQTLATTTDILFFSGLGLVALGTTLVVVDLLGSEGPSSHEGLTFDVSPAGVSLQGRF